MKKHVYLLLVVCALFSCGNREMEETRRLMDHFVYAEVNKLSDTVLISNKAITNWMEVSGIDSCIIGDLMLNDKLGLGVYRAENYKSDFLTESDYDKLCRESVMDFQFSQDHFSEGAVVVSEEYIEEYRQRIQAERQVMTSMTYYSFSKPVFFQRFKYAFIYRKSASFHGPNVDASTVFVFFEKGEDGEWKVFFAQTLMMT